MATIGDIGVAVSKPTSFNVSLSEKQEDQNEKVVSTILSGVEEAAAESRDFQETGKVLNVTMYSNFCFSEI